MSLVEPVRTVRAFLISVLTRQWLGLGDGFVGRYPHAWLVWEPGSWSAPTEPDSDQATTQSPVAPKSTWPVKGDALCFELGDPSRPTAPLCLGRAMINDIVVNDATISRNQLELTRSGADWRVRSLGLATTELEGTTLSSTSARSLKSGYGLVMGNVRMTYYDPVGFRSRLEKEAERLRNS